MMHNGHTCKITIDRAIGNCVGIKRMNVLGRKGYPEVIPSHIYISLDHFIELNKLLNDKVKLELSYPGSTAKWFKWVRCHWEYDLYLRKGIHNSSFLNGTECANCRRFVSELKVRSVWWFEIGNGNYVRMAFKACEDTAFKCSMFSIRTYGTLEVELDAENSYDGEHLRRTF